MTTPTDPSATFFQEFARRGERLRRIAAAMSGQEWSADTLDAVAAIMRDAGYTIADTTDESDEWDAPTCLRWLAVHTSGPNHYNARADHWPDEVARFAAYERRSEDEWNATATDELRARVRAVALGELAARGPVRAEVPPPGAWRSVIRETERGPFALYLLPDCTPVWIDDSAAKGYPLVDYTMQGGAIVTASRARIDDAGRVAGSGYDPASLGLR